MIESQTNVKLAIHPGIGFGSKLNAKQLRLIAHYLPDDAELELTTFQQLYIEVPEANIEQIRQDFEAVGLATYPVGNYVKSLRTCNFCKGELEEGMPVAKEINRRIAGKPVPFTVKVAYTGCAVGCGEPLVNDIGIMKIKDGYQLYIGGKAKGKDAQIATLVKEDLAPEALYEMIDTLLNFYAEHGKKRENFPKFVHRFGGPQALVELVEG